MGKFILVISFLFSLQLSAQLPSAFFWNTPKQSSGLTTPTFVKAADMGVTTGTSKTYSFTVDAGTNRCVIIGINGDNATGADDFTGATINGNSFSLVNKTTNISGRFHYLCQIANPPVGTYNIVISFSSSHNINGFVAQFNGINGIDHNRTTSTGATTSYTFTDTTFNNNAMMVIMEGGYNGGNPPSAGSGLTRGAYGNTYGDYGMFYSTSLVSPAGQFVINTTRTSTTGGQGRSYNILALYMVYSTLIQFYTHPKVYQALYQKYRIIKHYPICKKHNKKRA